MVFPKNLKEGAKFRAFCSVTGSPPFTFKWMKNNRKLPEDDTVSTENAQDYSILVIGKLRKSHAGNYTCVVLNRGGATRHTSELIVNGKYHAACRDFFFAIQWHLMVEERGT